MLDIRDPKDNAWNFDCNLHKTQTTYNMITPNHLMQLVPCNHKDSYQTKHYVFLKNTKVKDKMSKVQVIVAAMASKKISIHHQIRDRFTFDEFEI